MKAEFFTVKINLLGNNFELILFSYFDPPTTSTLHHCVFPRSYGFLYVCHPVSQWDLEVEQSVGCSKQFDRPVQMSGLHQMWGVRLRCWCSRCSDFDLSWSVWVPLFLRFVSGSEESWWSHVVDKSASAPPTLPVVTQTTLSSTKLSFVKCGRFLCGMRRSFDHLLCLMLPEHVWALQNINCQGF